MHTFDLRTPKVERRHDGYIYGKYEPGNGTSYQAIAVRIKGTVSCGWLGTVTDGWLVVSGMASCRGYLVPRGGFLHPSWVAEHFDLHGEDAYMFTELLRVMLEGEVA